MPARSAKPRRCTIRVATRCFATSAAPSTNRMTPTSSSSSKRPFDEHNAVLLCSDGLSDMLPPARSNAPSASMRVIPQRVVEALIQAANEAGGRDNITVVYVEGASFAAIPGAAPTLDAGSTTRAIQSPSEGTAAENARPAISREAGSRGWRVGCWRASRLGLALAWTLSTCRPLAAPTTSRTPRCRVGSPTALLHHCRRTVVGITTGHRPGRARRYAEDARAARRCQPGGPRSRHRDAGGAAWPLTGWVSVPASGDLGNRIDGIRVVGRADAPHRGGPRARRPCAPRRLTRLSRARCRSGSTSSTTAIS